MFLHDLLPRTGNAAYLPYPLLALHKRLCGAETIILGREASYNGLGQRKAARSPQRLLRTLLFGQVAAAFLMLRSAYLSAELVPTYPDPERGAREANHHHAQPERRHGPDALRAL
jgi:hypothetical protein